MTVFRSWMNQPFKWFGSDAMTHLLTVTWWHLVTAASEAVLPWSPESPDPPWLPKLPDPPWPPKLPNPPWVPERAPPWRPSIPELCPLRPPERPPPPPRWMVYGAGRAVRDGGVKSVLSPRVLCFPSSRAHIWFSLSSFCSYFVIISSRCVWLII